MFSGVNVFVSDTCIINIVIIRLITDMRITRIDMTDIFSKANCHCQFDIITLDISYRLPSYYSSYNINSNLKANNAMHMNTYADTREVFHPQSTSL